MTLEGLPILYTARFEPPKCSRNRVDPERNDAGATPVLSVNALPMLTTGRYISGCVLSMGNAMKTLAQHLHRCALSISGVRTSNLAVYSV
jgi:hypothetical protein